MATIHLVNGRQFVAESGVSLLDAASSAGIGLPYSCRTGRCSTCKARVEHGHTNPLVAEAGLSPQELADGWILTCAREAVTDVALEVEDLGTIHLPQPKTLPCRIAELAHIASDVLQVKLRLPPASAFSYIPGQYIDVIGPSGIRRSYSLANANSPKKLLELHVRAVAGGAMSNYWFNQAQTNDLLRLYGPLGTFFLRECADLDIFFLATGTGIAPIKAILESLLDVPSNHQPKSITVFWGGRKPQDLYFNLAAIPVKQRYTPIISRISEGWTGATGYVQDALLSLAPDLTKAAVYACGSDTMIHSAKQTLISRGLPPARFYSDAFVISGNSLLT